ncbi:hypothetical protein L6164_031577 [Bauhinia variegata]|uniref:Uncharacterized protein n=1 Tax=Bauhinia variegata TaxID=167791 RepID=A0ACB9LFV6_BAUVA|nr:hypothetical protein L6164_031577 [Bauhinia variegata]
MDYLKHSKKFEAQNWSRLSQNSHRIIKFLLPFSVFSALIPFLPLLVQSLKPFFMQFHGYTNDKTYMFLVCNGLLVFIVKNSGLIDGSKPSANQSKELYTENPESGRAEMKVLESEKPIKVLPENHIEIECPDEDKSWVISEEQDDGDDGVLDVEEEHEDENDAVETEELNKKCEDFIRKMKAAFCSEPRFAHNSNSDYQKALSGC